jgi:hypothetical protein
MLATYSEDYSDTSIPISAKGSSWKELLGQTAPNKKSLKSKMQS